MLDTATELLSKEKKQNLHYQGKNERMETQKVKKQKRNCAIRCYIFVERGKSMQNFVKENYPGAGWR